jgi:hypothetical protein
VNNSRAKKITARIHLVQDQMFDPVRSMYRRAWMTRGIDITDDIATKS